MSYSAGSKSTGEHNSTMASKRVVTSGIATVAELRFGLFQRAAQKRDALENVVVVGIARYKSEAQIHLISGLHRARKGVQIHGIEAGASGVVYGTEDKLLAEAEAAKRRARPQTLHLTGSGDSGNGAPGHASGGLAADIGKKHFAALPAIGVREPVDLFLQLSEAEMCRTLGLRYEAAIFEEQSTR